jgi:uncharacterized protein (TIGR02284 family)
MLPIDERTSMANEDIVDILNGLLEASKDGEHGFQSSAEYLRSPGIRQFFLSRAQQCREAASELQTLVRELGGTPEGSGTAGAAMRRGWVAVKGTLAGYSDKAILEDAEQAQARALASYRDAYQAGLPPNVRAAVKRQLDGVQANHRQVRSLRDEARAASESTC